MDENALIFLTVLFSQISTEPNLVRALISYWFIFPERLREERREKKKRKNQGKR
jgi:hypothetical protein